MKLIEIIISPQVNDFLETLASSGFFGDTPAAVAERLLSQRIWQMMAECLGQTAKDKP